MCHGSLRATFLFQACVGTLNLVPLTRPSATLSPSNGERGQLRATAYPGRRFACPGLVYFVPSGLLFLARFARTQNNEQGDGSWKVFSRWHAHWDMNRWVGGCPAALAGATKTLARNSGPSQKSRLRFRRDFFLLSMHWDCEAQQIEDEHENEDEDARNRPRLRQGSTAGRLLVDFAEEPGAGVGPMAFGGGL